MEFTATDLKALLHHVRARDRHAFRMACLAETTTQFLAPERDTLSESVFRRKLLPGFDLQTGMPFPVEASSGKRIP